MPWWKQILLCLLLIVVSAALWYRFYPGAAELAAEWGIGQHPAAAAVSQDSPRNGGSRRGGGGFPMAQSPIIASPVTSATINNRLSAIGTGSALRTVAVRPFSSGWLTEIPVEPGTEVEAGQIIARMDSQTEEIELDRAQLALDDAQARLERILALRSSNTATAVEQTDAELEVRNAELALREARLALERRDIKAPIGGFIGILPVSEGDYVTSSDDIATISDRSEILVDLWVPERYATLLEVGTPVSVQSVARPNETYSGTIRAIDNQVDPESRTLRVQAHISNPADILRSGMAFRVEMQFEGQSFPAVDPLAVQWGTQGSYVWVVRDGTALQTPVRIIQRNADYVLVEGTFADDDRVVVEGVHLVRDGQGVRIAGDEDVDSRRDS